MKKACFIIPEYNEDTAGHFYHHYEFLEKLSEILDIFLIAEKGSSRPRIFHIKKTYVQRFKFLPLRFLESFFVILRVRLLGYKIFYTHISYIGAINAAIISRMFKGKSYYWNCAMNWLFKQRTLPGLGYRLGLKLSHYLVTGSEKMKQGYAEHYHLNPAKIKVMPNWINLNRFQLTNLAKRSGQPSTRVILFVHWLSKRKGADMLVPIILHLKSLIPKFKFLVIGEGPYKEKLIEEIKKNKLENFIEIIGGIPNKDLSEYYAKADIFIMPSMEEGFPRVLLEAMAMGIPYVASDVGAVREISPPTAQRFLVKPGDTELFAHKIEILLSDKELYDNFRKEELEKIKEYSLEKVIDKFIETIS